MQLAAQNLYFLHQGRQLLDRLDDRLFSQAPTGLSNASVGAHLRHAIDCYRCFLAGLADGKIDYDARQRQTAVESDRTTADAAMAEIACALEGIDHRALEDSLDVKVDAAAWEDPAQHWHRSTLGRELQFLLSHTVHHYALIALILRAQGFDPGADFGVAPSTLEHQRSLEMASPCAR